jgi:cystathionine gamma-synthase
MAASMSDATRNQIKLRTRIAQAMHFIDEDSGAVVPPIFATSTFARDDNLNLRNGYLYARHGTPTVHILEDMLTELEGGEGAMTFASGLAAFTCLFETVRTGQHIVAPTTMYFAGLNWLKRICEYRNIRMTMFDPGDLNSLARAIEPGETKIIWAETPANPTWEVTDIEYVARLAHEAGAILVVDSTCASPVTTRPLELGADMVFHSATKYLNGHSDITAGVLITGEQNKLWDDMNDVRYKTGGIIASFEAWLLIRGLRTLFIRFDVASKNAMAFARHFENHPKIERVLYPGLESHPQHDVAKKQMTCGFSGMLSVLVKGDYEATKRVTLALKVFIPATSLGGVESLAEHRKGVEGPDSAVPDNLIRISIGIEDADDLIADLEQALLVL